MPSQQKTPVPSAFEHGKILVTRMVRKDLKKPVLWFAKFIGIALLLMLYTLGVFVNYDQSDDSSFIVGDYRIFKGEKLSDLYPSTMKLAGFDSNFVSQLRDIMLARELGISLNYSMSNTSLSFQEECQGTIADLAKSEVCIFFDTEDSYTIFYGGKEYSTPFQTSLAATQLAINSVLLNVRNITELYSVESIQNVPRLVDAEGINVPLVVLLLPACMHVLSAVIMTMFVIGPITFEKINSVTRSFLLVGVTMRTYLFQWLAYFALNGIITALLLSLVSIFYRLFPLSSFGLIFVSHYLGLVQLYAMFIIVMQVIAQEELAQGIPWLVGLASIAAGVALLMFQSPNSILFTVCSIISPFVGMMQYYGIYITYDSTGYDTGIHVGDNVLESGLLGNMIAQLVGICLWVMVIVLYSSSNFAHWLSHFGGKSQNTTESNQPIDGEGNYEHHFEPLTPGSDVLVSVRGLEHTYYPSRYTCDKNAKPAEVLKGLNLDICRGEVFGYLGHNGAGKSTSVNILAGELQVQHGCVVYHFRDGVADIAESKGADAIRHKIGVCPQHNTALQDDLTCRETLRLFAYLKGGITMDEHDTVDEAVEAEVNRRLDDVQFTSDEDADKMVGTYSGGMKRKVLIAMALLGDPEVVFLDEPTAGLDPYNRRTIWDMIIAAKKGRSILLTSHFLDEVDVLSDRIGIMKDGKLICCGSSLFLKHHFGVGYTLSFDAEESFDVSSIIPTAKVLAVEKQGTYRWQLNHGVESSFPDILTALHKEGATKIALDLTTLEQVFLETGREEEEDIVQENLDHEEILGDVGVENTNEKVEQLVRIWAPRGEIKLLSFWKKLLIAQQFMMTNAWKTKRTISLNIVMPLIYMVTGFVLVSLVDVTNKGEIIENDPIALSPFLTGEGPSKFFGVPDIDSVSPLYLIQPATTPVNLEDYFVADMIPLLGGYFDENRTLQYEPELTPFALQIGAFVLSQYSTLESTGINTTVQQLPYFADAPFRIDLLMLPLCLAFGFAGMAFSVLDVLLLKGDNIIGIFRVAGISEFMVYVGVMMYKTSTTFLPFFILTIILGLSLDSVLFGSDGRWLGTILVMLGYAYSTSPLGLLIAKLFIHSDFKSVANWFPGVYFTLVSMPYLAWASALQAAPGARETILTIGDILCIVPQVAFQRGLGAIIEISSVSDDKNITWGDVWRFESRVWFTILMMCIAGSIEWVYLFKLTNARESKTKLSSEETELVGKPVDLTEDVDVIAERTRSQASDEGINARELVKVFRIKPSKDSKSKETVLKRAVKGVSFGIRKNEIFALLGPNGAGKTVTMSILAGQYAPEYGEVALAGRKATEDDRSIDHLYDRCRVAYCSQFDALFPKMTVVEHVRFYARVRGLDWNSESTQLHVNAIVKLLGLEKYYNKEATELSGGYKRRLCLGVAMIGYPSVMMVDECTTGLDPAARRLIWDVLKPAINYDHEYDIPAILLSSHYMDECQVLGTRIGIMIDGEIATTGSLERLQELYCNSYFVEISLETTATTETAESKIIDTFMRYDMPSKVYESLPYRFKLQVPFVKSDSQHDGSIEQLAHMFDILESNKEDLGIKFYSVTPMNLEQIFIDLSRKQFDVAEVEKEQSIR